MKLRECVDELRLELKIVFTNWWKLDARWKCGYNRMDLSCKDVGWAITRSGLGSNLGGDMFLVNLDEFGSLDRTCIHKHYHKQVHQKLIRKNNQA